MSGNKTGVLPAGATAAWLALQDGPHEGVHLRQVDDAPPARAQAEQGRASFTTRPGRAGPAAAATGTHRACLPQHTGG
jgi:hypothetical protein